MMVDESRNTTVRVQFRKFWAFLFFLVKLEVYSLVGELELIEDMGDLPINLK